MKNLKTFEQFINEERYFYGNPPEDNNPEGWKDLKFVGDVWPSLKDILSNKPQVKSFKGNDKVVKWWNNLEKWHQDFIMSKLKVKSTSDISVQSNDHWKSIVNKEDKDVDGLEYLYLDASRFISFPNDISYYHKEYSDVYPDGYGNYITKKGKESVNIDKNIKDKNSIISAYKFKKKFLEPHSFIPNGIIRDFIVLSNSKNKLG
tara:strand:+ start:93 stop:704 length:612 start_codon:yes stop_codon:yes gene_type:complete